MGNLREEVEEIASQYGESLDEHLVEAGSRDDETHQLEYIKKLLDTKALAGAHRTETFNLTLRGMLGSGGDVHGFARAYVASLIEPALIPPPSPSQLRELAVIQQVLARQAGGLSFFEHGAELAASAGATFSQLGDVRDADSAMYLARTLQVQGRSSRVGFLAISRVAAGYGYRPYRLMSVWVVFVALFSLLYLPSSRGLNESVQLSASTQLGLVSPPVSEGSELLAWAMILQTTFGLVIVSVFFALIVRRWFRS